MKPRYISLSPLIPWLNKIHPVEWKDEFGRANPLEVEIGFGLGDYLVSQAQENPSLDFVGIEMEWPFARRALRKIAISGVKNVRILHVDATIAFERLFSEHSLAHICSLFPCPWPKRKHTKYRLFSRNFLRILNSRLTEGGDILIVTDNEDYMNWILHQTPETGFEANKSITPAQFRTKYEKKWHSFGQNKFYEIKLKKQYHTEISPTEGIILKTHRVDHFNPEQFRPSGSKDRCIVEFKDVLFDTKRQIAMIRVFVKEDNLSQNFWIEVVKKNQGWHVRPAKGCSFIPTMGAQRALDLTRDGICT